MQIQKTKFRAGQTKTTLFSATTRCKTKLLFVRTCDKLQSTVFCTSRLWLCSKKRFFSLLPIAKQSCFCNKPATSCDKLQNAVFCTSRLWLCSKKRFFRYYQLQNKVAFAINLRQLQRVAKRRILHFTLVAVANIFTSVVCVRLVVIFTDAKLCLPNLPKRNSSRQG